MPSNVAARMTLAADPESLHGAVAAGILGCGPVVLGTSESCARLLAEAQEHVAAGEEPAAVADRIARTVHGAGGKVPGFGHPVHRPVDPRAERILELADERAVSGPHVLLARCLRDSVAATWGKPLPLNVSMPIAAVMLDLGFSIDAVKAIPDPGADGRPARPPGGGARATARASSSRARQRRRSSTSRLPRADARTGGRGPPVGRAARARRRGATAHRSSTSSSARPSTARSSRTRASPPPLPRAGSARSHSSRSRTRASSRRRPAPRTRSVPTSPPSRPRSSGSTRRAAPPAPRPTFP